jgi:hypothetical protein
MLFHQNRAATSNQGDRDFNVTTNGLRVWTRLMRGFHQCLQLIYEWVPVTGHFSHLGDPVGLRFRDNWQRVAALLQAMPQPLTVPELRHHWPPDDDKPAASQLHEWLMRAHAEGLVHRTGQGKKGSPFRWGMSND